MAYALFGNKNSLKKDCIAHKNNPNLQIPVKKQAIEVMPYI